MKDNEQAIVRAAVEYLLVRGIPCWRQNTGAVKSGKRFVRFAMPGCSDILGCLPPDGRFLAIEVKHPSNRKGATEEQKAFLDAINGAGGLGFVARSLEDIDRELDAAGVPDLGQTV